MSNHVLDSVSQDSAVGADLSIMGLFLQADIVVQAVMGLLVLASIWTWAVIFEKAFTIRRLNRHANRFEEQFWSGESLDRLVDRVSAKVTDPMTGVFVTGMTEWRNGSGAATSALVGTLPRVEKLMLLEVGREMARVERYMTFLASVGSTAPFIGLFGTVWGIMNSFAAIANTKNTSLAVVAPGIAEALFATALGLVAAIPAVLAYNKLGADLSRYANRLEGFVDEFMAILARHGEAKA